MPRATRLSTWVDIDDRTGGESIRARLDAVLDDGRRIVLLDDRGWSGSRGAAGFGMYGEDVEETARHVVGPDEAWGEITQEEMNSGHWRELARRLHAQGVEVEPDELGRLPHDVEVSERLAAQVARNRMGGG